MKTPVIAIAASAAFFASIDYAAAGSYEDYFGGQEGVNKHLQGSINDMQEFDHHLQGSINDDRERLDEHGTQIGDLYGQVDANNTASIERDTALSGRMDERVQYDATQDAYATQTRQRVTSIHSWSIEQFNRQGAAINANTQAIANERHERQEADRDLQAGIASAVAAGSHIMDANYQGLQVSVAGGAYRGASAASLALGGAFSDRTFGHVSVSHDSRGHQAIGGNVNWKF